MVKQPSCTLVNRRLPKAALVLTEESTMYWSRSKEQFMKIRGCMICVVMYGDCSTEQWAGFSAWVFT